MHKYWRINRSVRLVSVALQRWMSSIVLLITMWTAIRYLIGQPASSPLTGPAALDELYRPPYHHVDSHQVLHWTAGLMAVHWLCSVG